jgi:acyl-CoA synthetase (AMP-forming)/AMP-acid ligase II
MGLKRTDPDAEAALLFTSGTSALPKGVALSNRNLITNILQVSETGFVAKGDRLLTALPLFHSFGLTMGLLFPLVALRAIVTAPSPLDCDKLTRPRALTLPRCSWQRRPFCAITSSVFRAMPLAPCAES